MAAIIASTDFIKIKGLQSTPDEGASLQYFEVFEGIVGGDGVGAANVTTQPITSPTLPTIPGTQPSWGETLSRLFNLIGSLAGTAGEIIKTTAFGEIVEGILGLVASGAGSAAIAALMYLGSKIIGRFALDYLDEKTGFEADLMEQITAIREKMECLCVAANYWCQYDNDKSPTNSAESLHDIKQHLFELRKFLQTGKGDSQLKGEEGGIVQAIQDLQYNERERNIPGTNTYVHETGKFIRKNA